MLSSYKENLADSLAAFPLVRLTDGGTSPGVFTLCDGSFSLHRSLVDEKTSVNCSSECCLDRLLPRFIICVTPEVFVAAASCFFARLRGNVEGRNVS